MNSMSAKYYPDVSPGSSSQMKSISLTCEEQYFPLTGLLNSDPQALERLILGAIGIVINKEARSFQTSAESNSHTSCDVRVTRDVITVLGQALK